MKQVTFIDEANIKVKAGTGGDGGMFFHREKYVSHGGPSGGNGGQGGSVYLRATTNENTLQNFRGKTLFKAQDGTNGGNNNMTGANGEDLYIDVPVGTEVIENDKTIADLSFDGQIYLLQSGGKGGRGNASFKSSKNTAPTLYEAGEKPNWIEIKLNLKVLADVGLLGFPNAGKSTLVSSLSNAKPKIANYEFTTLQPQLGVVKHHDDSFVITDLPGLIEGASLNVGLGVQFLKHLSRTKLILHLIDSTADDLLKRYEDLRFELKNYSAKLNDLKEIIVFTKADLIDEEIKGWIEDEFKGKEIFFISSLTREGLNPLLDKVVVTLDEIKQEQENAINEIDENDFVYIKYEDNSKELHIENPAPGVWVISGEYVEYWANRIPLDSQENVNRIYKKFKNKGVIDKLVKAGMKVDDTISVEGTMFTITYHG